MSAKNKLDPVERHSFNCASLTGSYQTIDPNGFAYDLVIYKIYNSSSQPIDISYDGVTDHDFIPSGGTLILDIQANKEGERAAWPAKRQTFVKGTASAGSLYETGYTIKRL